MSWLYSTPGLMHNPNIMAARRTITMTLFNRPEYLRKVLGALSRCIGIERYHLIACVEPGNAEVLALARGVGFTRSTRVVENEKLLSCPVNVYQALSLAFLETDYNIHLEDDILLARDALLYFEHCGRAFRDDASVFTVTAYNNQKPPEPEWGRTARRAWFTPWSWATWRDRFEEMRPLWDFDYSHGNWDNNLNTRVRGERVEIFPILARAQNIGVEGVHIPSAEWGRTFHYNEFWAGRVAAPRNPDWAENPDWEWSPHQADPEQLRKLPREWLRAAGIPLPPELDQD